MANYIMIKFVLIQYQSENMYDIQPHN